MSLQNFLSLSSGPVLNIGSQKRDVDNLNLWYQYLADTSHRVKREAMCNKLMERGVLDRKNATLKIGRATRVLVTYVRVCVRWVSFLAVRDHLEGNQSVQIYLCSLDHLSKRSVTVS